jgi:Leucine-rich repeat (LRR) protein
MVDRRGFLLTAFAAASLRAQDDAAAHIIRLGGKLGRDASGQIIQADLSSAWVNDVDMRWLAQIPTLQEINLGRTRVTGKGLEPLSKLEDVAALKLRFAEFLTATDIGRLAPWKNLRRLDLRGTRVDSGVFERLAAHPRLEYLDISSTEVGDDGFEELAALTGLRELRCGANRLTGSALILIKTAPALRSLDVGGYQRVESGLWGLALNEQNLERLGSLTQLRALTLRGAKLADDGAGPTGNDLGLKKKLVGLENLAPLAELRSLDLGDLPIKSGDLGWLPALGKLAELDIDGSFQIDDAIVATLLKLGSLKRLNLAGTVLTDAALHQLAGMTSLQRLIVGGTQVTAGAAAAFARQRPDCRLISWNAP